MQLKLEKFKPVILFIFSHLKLKFHTVMFTLHIFLPGFVDHSSCFKYFRSQMNGSCWIMPKGDRINCSSQNNCKLIVTWRRIWNKDGPSLMCFWYGDPFWVGAWGVNTFLQHHHNFMRTTFGLFRPHSSEKTSQSASLTDQTPSAATHTLLTGYLQQTAETLFLIWRHL